VIGNFLTINAVFIMPCLALPCGSPHEKIQILPQNHRR
jgi:hypothetical protein